MMKIMWNNSFQDVDTGYDFDYEFNYEQYKEEHDRWHYNVIDDGHKFHFDSCPVCGDAWCVVLQQHKGDKTFKVQCEACDLETEECDNAEAAVKKWNDGAYTMFDERRYDFVSFGREEVAKALTSTKFWWDAVLD